MPSPKSAVKELLNGDTEETFPSVSLIKMHADTLFVHCYILSFVTIANIAWYYPLTITTRACIKPISYVFCTRATAIITSHCSHATTGEACPKGIGFVRRNTETSKRKDLYVNSISEIERITGITIIPLLPDDVAKEVKTKANLEDW